VRREAAVFTGLQWIERRVLLDSPGVATRIKRIENHRRPTGEHTTHSKTFEPKQPKRVHALLLQQAITDPMKSSFIFSAALVSALLAAPAMGAESHESWRWYYSGFGSPDASAKVLLRSGSATVSKSKADITVAMQGVDGTAATFIGKVSISQVNGMLSNFFPSEAVSYHGTYKTLQVGACKFEQIALSSDVPDGSIIMLSRVSGRCQ
jgi:hypothetical protein